MPARRVKGERELPQARIVPSVKALYLCDGCIGIPNQKTDLVGLFNSIRPPKYPHKQQQFVIFAQLTQGLGQVPFYLDVRFSATDQLVHTTSTQTLHFPNRHRVVQLALTRSKIVGLHNQGSIW
ncbi:MAG: hypothetical protein L0Z53_19725 [Acidobacteriales bacterium]|nr:hypothetical protein [Terriglobales bacterium]